jgi:hypothetical protein
MARDRWEDMTATLKLLEPRELSDIRCEYLLPLDKELEDVLVIAFYGTYRDGSLGNPDAAFMRGMVMGALATYAPSCLLLDFRGLVYRWGNSLLGIFQDVDEFMNDGTGLPFPVLTVASDKCVEALHSLLSLEGSSTFHHVDFDLALAEASRQARLWLES